MAPSYDLATPGAGRLARWLAPPVRRRSNPGAFRLRCTLLAALLTATALPLPFEYGAAAWPRAFAALAE